MIRMFAAALAATAALAPLAATAAPADDMTAKERIEKRAEAMTARFAKLDANADGVLDKAEASKPMETAFDRVDTNKDGVVDEAERTAFAEKVSARIAKRGGDAAKRDPGARFVKADADKDGRTTREEFLAMGPPWFERIDADKDGKVSKAEMDAFTEKLQKRADRVTGKSAN